LRELISASRCWRDADFLQRLAAISQEVGNRPPQAEAVN
jgi:hypothetical protein